MDPRYKSPTAAVVDHDADEEFRDLTTLSTVTIWMLRIGAAITVLGIWSGFQQLELLSRVYTSVEGAANDQREALISGATALLMIATIIVFGRWILLAHRNLPALGAQHLDHRPGWAVGYFFIPFLNWWKPYQAMRSLWRSSHSVHRPELQENTWLLPTWWTLWLAWSLLGNVIWRMQNNAHTIEDLTTLTVFELFSRCAYGVLCIVASLLVARTWRAQVEQHEHPEEAPRGFADAA